MYLTRFYCQNFRCLAELDFEPSAGINVICGHNAQGKTSLLEGILFAATSKSHRTNNEQELVRHGENGFRLSATAKRCDREVTLEAFWYEGIKRFRVNGVAQTRMSDILGKLSAVLFSPEDIGLVKGAGTSRRRFVDMELAQILPEYLNALQRYRHALRQRNELLRHTSPDPELLDIWDHQLGEHGTVLVRERTFFLRQLAEHAADVYGEIASGELLAIDYASDVGPEHSILEVLGRSRSADIRRQTTLHGPHRDDVDIAVAGQPARNYGSQGQQKTVALALKLAVVHLIKERTNEYPLLMLDEVLSELDEKRSRQLFKAVPAEVQCLLTTTSVTRREVLTAQNTVLFQVDRGELRRE
jgi:DNA replication and repair protein RecF